MSSREPSLFSWIYYLNTSQFLPHMIVSCYFSKSIWKKMKDSTSCFCFCWRWNRCFIWDRVVVWSAGRPWILDVTQAEHKLVENLPSHLVSADCKQGPPHLANASCFCFCFFSFPPLFIALLPFFLTVLELKPWPLNIPGTLKAYRSEPPLPAQCEVF